MKNSLRKRIRDIMSDYGMVFLAIEFDCKGKVQFFRGVYPLRNEYYRLINITDCSLVYQSGMCFNFHYFVHFYDNQHFNKTIPVSKEIYNFLLMDMIQKIQNLNSKTFKMRHARDLRYISTFHFRPIQFSFLL